MLTISVGEFSALNNNNRFSLPEAGYLLWGHDGRELEYHDGDCEEAYPLLERKWLMQTTYTEAHPLLPTMVKLQLPENCRDRSEACFLMIDRSGTGNFSSGKIDHIPQSRIDEQGYVYFDNVLWDTDASGKDVFTFSFGPVMQLSSPHFPPAHTLPQEALRPPSVEEDPLSTTC